MDIQTAHNRINDLAAAMIAKGMRTPTAEITLAANVEPRVYIKWKSGIDREGYYGDEKFEFLRGATVDEAIDKAFAFVDEQDDAEQAKLKDFMAALGHVIDIGKEHGIEADYMNPIVASMKKLSKNIITDQRAA